MNAEADDETDDGPVCTWCGLSVQRCTWAFESRRRAPKRQIVAPGDTANVCVTIHLANEARFVTGYRPPNA